MKEKMCTHLTKRGSTYYFRRKTPIDLVHIFGAEIMKSLGSKDRREAEVLVRKMGSHYDELFAQARIRAPEGDQNTPAIASPQASKIKAPAFDAGLTLDDAPVYASRFLRQLKLGRERAVSEEKLGVYYEFLDVMVKSSEEFIQTGSHPIDILPSPIWKYEAQIRAIKALRENIDLPFMESQHSRDTPLAPNKGSMPKLNDLVNKWAAERAPRPQSIAKMRRVIARFVEVVGSIPITAITKVQVVSFKDGLLAGGSTPANVNQYLTEFNTLLNFAKSQAVIENNPASGVRVVVRKSAKETRQPFDLTALKLIFSSPIYTGSHRPKGGKGEAAYWLPLLALFTGARLEELCQLTTSDVYEEDYQDEAGRDARVWVLNVTDEGDDQKLKNVGSRRRIPIHQELVALGFIEYVQATKEGNVFPELHASREGKLSASWSKWFSRYLRKVILISDKRMVFHSFRHCFKDYARTAGIPSEVHNALTGHSSGDVADDYGSEKYPLRPLAEAMGKYKVHGLQLPTKA